MKRKVFLFMIMKKLNDLRIVKVEYINNDNEILTPDDFEFEIICTAFELENDPVAMKIYSTMRLDIIDHFADELLIF